eukprot:631470-Pyramimonas_sp.AAC.1
MKSGFELFPGRASVAHFAGIVPGGVAWFNVYLKDSQGMSDFNYHVLQAVFRAAKQIAKASIIGGGFNLEPQELAASGFLNALKLK